MKLNSWLKLYVLMRFRSSKNLLILVLLLIMWLAGLVSTCGIASAYDDLELGDYIIYRHSVKESGASDSDQFKIYYIEFIDTSNPDSEEIYASVYLSDMPTGGWVEVDVWKHLASLNSLSYIGNVLYDPSYQYSTQSSNPFVWNEFLPDLIHESSFAGLASVTSYSITKFRTIWFKSGYTAKIEANTNTWFSTETESWIEKEVYSNLHLDIKITQYFSSTGVMLYRSVIAHIELNYEKYIPGFYEMPFESGTEKIKLTITSKIDSDHSSISGINDTPWKSRNWTLVLIIIGSVSVSTIVFYLLIRTYRRKLGIVKLDSQNTISASDSHLNNSLDNKEHIIGKQSSAKEYAIICPNCGRENQIHAKYCLECNENLGMFN